MYKLLVAGKQHPSGVSRIVELKQEGHSVSYIEDITEKPHASLTKDLNFIYSFSKLSYRS